MPRPLATISFHFCSVVSSIFIMPLKMSPSFLLSDSRMSWLTYCIFPLEAFGDQHTFGKVTQLSTVVTQFVVSRSFPQWVFHASVTTFLCTTGFRLLCHSLLLPFCVVVVHPSFRLAVVYRRLCRMRVWTKGGYLLLCGFCCLANLDGSCRC